jgi:hypothetical protein
MNGFHPYNTDSSLYSCWQVFVMPYNLLPNKCLREGFIFLTHVIPGLKEPKMQMKELCQGIDAYDNHLKC